MNRRKFIYSTGAIITLASLASATTIFSNDKDKIEKRPNPNSFKEPVLKGIAFGINAPNPHNTQAWKFKLISENDFLFYVDSNRLLKATDPSTRQIHIGCGCFLECMTLGMQKTGYKTIIEIFPKGNYTKSAVGNEPIAKVTFSKYNIEKYASISDYIFQRKTSRLKYNEQKITRIEFDDILKKITSTYSEIRLINDSSELKTILPILYKGMEIESYTYKTHDETRKWFRENDDLIRKNKDGVNLPSNGVFGVRKWFAERDLKNLNAEKWHAKKSTEPFLKNHKEKVLSSKGIVTFTSNTNTFNDWIQTGRDYMKFQLACTENNIFMQPLSQVLQEFKEMDILRTQFEQTQKISNPKKNTNGG